jgi:hypothetical protein
LAVTFTAKSEVNGKNWCARSQFVSAWGRAELRLRESKVGGAKPKPLALET